MQTFTGILLAFLLLWNQWAFGGVHVWAETVSQLMLFGLAWLILLLVTIRFVAQSVRRRQENPSWLGLVRHPAIPFFLLLLLWSGAQLIPVSPETAKALFPQVHETYHQLLRADIWQQPRKIPLTLEWFRTLQAWVEHLSYFLFFLLAMYALQDKKSAERCVAFLLFLALFQVVYGLTQTYSPTQNIWWWENTLYPGWLTGTYLGRNNLAGFLELTIPLSFGLGAATWPERRGSGLGQRRPGWMRRPVNPRGWIRRAFVDREGLSKSLLLISLGTLLGVGLLLTGSRGGIISFAVGCLIMAIMLSFKRSSRFFGGITALAATLIIVLGLYIGLEQTAQRFLQVESLENRIHITRSVWQMVRDHPLSGVGLGNFNDAYTSRYALEGLGRHHQLVYAHNDWIQVAAEMGIPGLILAVTGYLTVLILALRAWHRRRDRYVRCLGAGLIAGYIALGVHSFFDYNLHIPANILTFLLCMVLLHQVLQLGGDSRKQSDISRHRIPSRTFRKHGLALTVLAGFSLAVFVLFGFVVRQYQAEALCPTRINSTKDFGHPPSLREVSLSVSLSPKNPEYRIESGRAYLRLLQGENPAIKASLLPEATSCFRQGVRLDPANGLCWFYLGQTLAQQLSWGREKPSLKQIATCLDLALRYHPLDFRIALRSGKTLLWLSTRFPQLAAEADFTDRAVEAFRLVLDERRDRWKEVAEIIRRYRSKGSVARAVTQYQDSELRQQVLRFVLQKE